MITRETKPSDAKLLVRLFKKLDTETSFMLFEPGERKTSLEKQERICGEYAESVSKVMLIAELDSSIVGMVVGIGGLFARNKHSLYTVLGVEKAHWGKGIAYSLMCALEEWAKNRSFHRLELTVMEPNVAARSLYSKCGFVEEGVKRDSMKVNDAYVNEFYMSKLL